MCTQCFYLKLAGDSFSARLFSYRRLFSGFLYNAIMCANSYGTLVSLVPPFFFFCCLSLFLFLFFPNRAFSFCFWRSAPCVFPRNRTERRHVVGLRDSRSDRFPIFSTVLFHWFVCLFVCSFCLSVRPWFACTAYDVRRACAIKNKWK